ncbi:MAG: Rieske (2Fe-2S) protein [Rhodospirillales bacterium]
MTEPKDRRIWIGTRADLATEPYRRLDILYAGKPATALVFGHKGEFRAYVNQCVHMPRTLDCLQDMIFDETGQFLRCSMHGIVYDPESGASVSTLCEGEKLTPIKLVEDDQGVWFRDKRVKVPGLAD